MFIHKTKFNDDFTEWFQMEEEFTTPYKLNNVFQSLICRKENVTASCTKCQIVA